MEDTLSLNFLVILREIEEIKNIIKKRKIKKYKEIIKYKN